MSTQLNYKQYNKYLYPLWAIGGFLFIYLCLPFINPKSGIYAPDILAGKEQLNLPFIPKQNKNTSGNEALLFVTINKKQFLTKFVTYISDDELADKQQSDTTLGKAQKSFIIVGRKKSNKPPKSSSDDFFIKAAPKI